MKKVILLILVFVCILILIIGCSKTEDKDKSLDFSFDKNGNYVGFSDLPSDYTIDKAKDDGYFVTENSEAIANQNVWDDFVETSLHKKNASIRIIKFYTESTDSPYFLDLFYRDGYYYPFDSSADNLEKQSYSYLLTLKGQIGRPLKDSSVIVLTNDDTLTFDKIMKAPLSSSISYKESISQFKIIMYK